ncbi:hypothetical protein J6I90_08975 [Pseudidiomarina sp. 1APP75-32.1]|uniref:Uncharacterized protein n=1 Tax=Pseudidiomarina terrestris TaxID=2820060 RepID=A0AAW7R000_9GAMM|nr:MULTISPECIES: hypothetical protein [unclassified Pseudidiomarina]MDN7125016.1 hypothetical protein [Pseudidiomarina sp. 1APP75-32.1]MDN7129509.1 hypothetical protein [Pseudidiomarina sp. 1APR75-15]
MAQYWFVKNKRWRALMVDTYKGKISKLFFVTDAFNVISFLKNESSDFPKCIFKMPKSSLSNENFVQIIKLLVAKNCKLIAFSGNDAEHYHDMADDYLVGLDFGTEVMTTFHDEEPDDEVANFVVNGISTINSNRVLLIVEDIVNDPIKNKLLKL